MQILFSNADKILLAVNLIRFSLLNIFSENFDYRIPFFNKLDCGKEF